MGVTSCGRPTVLDLASIAFVTLVGYYYHGLVGAGAAGFTIVVLFLLVEYLVIIPAEQIEQIEDEAFEDDPPNKEDQNNA